MAYQEFPRFNPNYGNRYGFRQKPAPSISEPGSASIPKEVSGGTTRPGGADYHSGVSAEDQGQVVDQGGGENTYGGGQFNSQDDYASDVRGRASTGLGYEYGRATPAQMLSGIAGVFGPPGLSSLVDYGAKKSGWGSGGIDPMDQYGAVGTADIVTGGVFGADQRAYDPITGRGLNSYADKDAFKSGAYVQGIMNDPFNPQSYLSDPDNAYSYTEYDPTDPTGTAKGLQGQGFQFAMDKGMYAADEDLGTLPTKAEKDLVAQHVGQTEYGFEEHTVAPDTATNQAIQGIGYTDSGAATKGSQFSSTGTFQTQHSKPPEPTPAPVVHDTNNDNNDDGGWSESYDAGGEDVYSDGYDSWDDGGSSDSGGGGGK